MDFQFEAPSGERVKRYGIGIVIRDPKRQRVWWDYAKKRWVDNAAELSKGGSNMVTCRTFRAFKSHLRRHGRDLVGCRVEFVNRFHGHDVVVQL
jgi:hypothetical protein